MHLRANHLLLMLIYEEVADNRKNVLLSNDVYVNGVVRYSHIHMVAMYLGIPAMHLIVGLWKK